MDDRDSSPRGKILQKIPYAKTVTYGEIAKEIAKEKGIKAEQVNLNFKIN